MIRKPAVLALLLAGVFAVGAQAQVISYSPRSGDVWIDTELNYVNDYGRRDRNFFVDDLVSNFGAPRYLVNELLDKRRWEPGDVYYASALAYQARRPLGDVARSYEQNRGQGWGVVAQRMGIKPGSAEFHALKGQVGKSTGRFKAKGKAKGGPAADERRDDDRNDGKGKDQGPGNSGNDNGNKGKAKGKDKGKGH